LNTDSIGIPKAERRFLENFDADCMIELTDVSTASQERFVPPDFPMDVTWEAYDLNERFKLTTAELDCEA